MAEPAVILPLVMVTALLLGVQPVSLPPVNAEEPFPPPEYVSGGENDTLADSEQLTEPGAAPEFGIAAV